MIQVVEQQVKLHLGCGTRKIPGYVNIDADKSVNPDIVSDITSLPMFKDESVSVIYACHVLEHFKRADIRNVLGRWLKLLKPNGILRLSVPDMAAVCEHYVYHRDFKFLQNLVYGDQKSPYQFHYHGWDFKSLEEELKGAGFTNTHLYDRDKTEHANVDDHSGAYSIKFDRKSKLMSLNVEATRPEITIDTLAGVLNRFPVRTSPLISPNDIVFMNPDSWDKIFTEKVISGLNHVGS